MSPKTKILRMLEERPGRRLEEIKNTEELYWQENCHLLFRQPMRLAPDNRRCYEPSSFSYVWINWYFLYSFYFQSISYHCGLQLTQSSASRTVPQEHYSLQHLLAQAQSPQSELPICRQPRVTLPGLVYRWLSTVFPILCSLTAWRDSSPCMTVGKLPKASWTKFATSLTSKSFKSSE